MFTLMLNPFTPKIKKVYSSHYVPQISSNFSLENLLFNQTTSFSWYYYTWTMQSIGTNNMGIQFSYFEVWLWESKGGVLLIIDGWTIGNWLREWHPVIWLHVPQNGRICMGSGRTGKSWNFILTCSRTGKSWKKTSGPR